MNKEITFTQGWIEKSVRKALKKERGGILQSDIEKIKYLRIGESFNNDFFVEMSTEEPPMPFVDTDGGDEWALECMKNSDISRFIDECMEETQLFTFGFEFEDNELEKYAWSDVAIKNWNNYKTSIILDNYYEKSVNNVEWENWYKQVKKSLAHELVLFTGVKVLRIKGLAFNDYIFLKSFPKLQVLEVVETRFANYAGIDELKKLSQLCCWLD